MTDLLTKIYSSGQDVIIEYRNEDMFRLPNCKLEYPIFSGKDDNDRFEFKIIGTCDKLVQIKDKFLDHLNQEIDFYENQIIKNDAILNSTSEFPYISKIPIKEKSDKLCNRLQQILQIKDKYLELNGK